MAETDVIHNILSGEAEQSLFACSHCRRQKVKCDRLLPTCSNCSKSSRECAYPLTVQKPGPKAGAVRRARPAGESNAHKQANGLLPSKRIKLVNHEDGPARAEQRGQLDHGRPTAQPSTTASFSTTSEILRNVARLDEHVLTDERLLKLVHPIHDPPDTTATSAIHEDEPGYQFQARFAEACVCLSCSPEQGRELLQAYHDYMTALPLFHEPSFELKLRSIRKQSHLTAFLAALFSYSLRFKHKLNLTRHASPSAPAMLEAACQLHSQCLDECLDDDPPLHLLQSFFVTTWQKLIHGVRGKSWRMLGEAIRIAYEVKLHMIDAEPTHGEGQDVVPSVCEEWVTKEERRRLWWSLWEADVFTATIRRLPSAIDDRLNFTHLPLSDEHWFSGTESMSSFLLPDASQRWRAIKESASKSSQTWFVLIASYMFDAHKMTSFPFIWARRIGLDADINATEESRDRLVSKMQDFIEDCLASAYSSLPPELTWTGEALTFRPRDTLDVVSPRAKDNARYRIHIIRQLGQLMLCTWQIQRHIANFGDIKSQPSTGGGLRANTHPNALPSSINQLPVWQRYVQGANLVADLVRCSNKDHIHYVDPLIANAIWYSAASLIVARLFGPRGLNEDKAQVNFDLLVSTLNDFESFWGIPKVLEDKMKTLEAALRALRAKTTTSRSSPERNGSNVGSGPHRAPTDDTIQYPNQDAQILLDKTPGQPSDMNQPIWEPDWLAFDLNSMPSLDLDQLDAFQQLPTPFEPPEPDPFMLSNSAGLSEFFSYRHE